MKFIASFLWFSLAFATPALAEAPPRLHYLEQQLASIGAANPGNLGFAALDLESGELVAIEGDNPFPMASTVKVAVAANYLLQVEHGRRSLDDRIGGRSARSLMEAMLIHSDNYATDLLLRDLGGPRVLQSWLTQVGVSGLRIDRNISQLLRARRDLKDLRDSSTPRAMVTLLKRIDDGSLLQPWSRSYLLGLMAKCMTGKNRIRGLLPAGTPVQNKTGTLNGYASDVGFITLPNGRRIAIALFARYGSNRPYTIARAARVIYNGFLYAPSPQRFTSLAPNSWTYQPAGNVPSLPLVQPPSQ
ncbi:MAG: class A beta-lactamase-related serine hydrolase [Pseudomonadota bacterium]|nr:class A beta-lactamase-related serine hydrolase [Pseudomonadota bacterium]